MCALSVVVSSGSPSPELSPTDIVGASILVLEKEGEVAAHQSSHNSGVVHSGLYYRPGSLKARLCVVGRKDVYDMCADYDIPYRDAASS